VFSLFPRKLSQPGEGKSVVGFSLNPGAQDTNKDKRRMRKEMKIFRIKSLNICVRALKKSFVRGWEPRLRGIKSATA